MNEREIDATDVAKSRHGYRTIRAAPTHTLYRQFIPTLAHGLRFNELTVIECHELLHAISGNHDAHVVDFHRGLEVVRTVHAWAQSVESGTWANVDSLGQQ